jgi:hypothetical protein
VSVPSVSAAVRVPGWVISGTLASSVTATVALAPGASVRLVGLHDRGQLLSGSAWAGHRKL